MEGGGGPRKEDHHQGQPTVAIDRALKKTPFDIQHGQLWNQVDQQVPYMTTSSQQLIDERVFNTWTEPDRQRYIMQLDHAYETGRSNHCLKQPQSDFWSSDAIREASDSLMKGVTALMNRYRRLSTTPAGKTETSQA